MRNWFSLDSEKRGMYPSNTLAHIPETRSLAVRAVEKIVLAEEKPIFHTDIDC